MKAFVVAGAICTACAGSAAAEQYLEYPGPTPFYPFQRSTLTGAAVFIPPYHRPFPIRFYTTPQQQPYSNVPPYSVISPY